MFLFRRPRFLLWLCLNVFFVVDIVLNSGWITKKSHQLIPVSVNLVNPTSSAVTQSRFPLETGNESDVKIQLLCWVSSTFSLSISHAENVIRETWGKRCDKLLFVYTNDTNNGKEERLSETDNAGIIRIVGRTTSEVLQHLYDHHLNDSHWFLKADENTYVVVEQLKTMLSVQDTGTPFYLAANDKEHPSIIGDVYVFNRAAIRRLVHHFRHPDVHQSSDEADCKRWGHFRNSGKSSVVLPTSFNRECLHRLGIVSYNTRDERGCERFLSNRLATELANHVNLVHSGDRCISRTAVIFRGVQYNQFHVYEHMLYRLKIIPDVLRQ
ncbi:glycoprotein-N-acetylgalactosamine 3-beta-galactosyltransferase 1-like [Daphnia magna]|uniref:glycoprotein-N-acetylgalactosamine 3-beta-galactosyltransferase 1-like n=1 Tax=Daphnia magna TaxID=35525 RepID=UPI001E1BD67A|nr:glycoprotein-N-acetylgalactosamine 3-beta-galactosyltransferase 1-like [Daphnia magna]